MKAFTVSGMCLVASTIAFQRWILQIEPSSSLLPGSKVQLYALMHAQFASLNFVQRLRPKKHTSDKNSQLDVATPLVCSSLTVGIAA